MTALDPAGGRRRMLGGMAANTFSFVSATGMQLLMVPVLVHFWGLSLYGVWVLLSTIPTYLALSNLGVGAVAGNEMAALLGAGNRAAAKATYATATMMIALLSAAIIMVGTVIVIALPANFMPVESSLSSGTIRLAILALVFYGALVLIADVPMGKYRATGRYGRGTSIASTIILAERAVVLAAAAAGFLPAIVLFVAARLAGTAWMVFDVERTDRDLRPSLRHASWGDAKRLTVLGAGMTLFTITLSLNLQGPIVVLGAVLAPAAVGLFSATRALTRLAFQATGIVTVSVNAEFAMAWGSEHYAARRRRLFALAVAVSVTASAAMVLTLLLFGQTITRVWLVGAAQPSFALIALLAVGSAVQNCWVAIGSLLLAANRQFAFTPVALLVAVATLALASIAVPRSGLEGMAALLCVAEAAMLVWVYVQAARVGVGSLRQAPSDIVYMAGKWLRERRARRRA